MTNTTNKMTNVTYPRRVPAYDTHAGVRLWRAIAQRRKCSMAAAIRQIAREEAERLGIPNQDENGVTE